MKTNGTIVNVQSREYDFSGKKATSIRASVIVGNAIFSVKVDPKLYEKLGESVQNVSGVLEFAISAFSMKPSLMLVAFEKLK